MTEKYIESETEKGTFYKVTEEITTVRKCTCKGFRFNGECKHITG